MPRSITASTGLALTRSSPLRSGATAASRRVMERLGMTRDPAEDFDFEHPRLPPGHRCAAMSSTGSDGRCRTRDSCILLVRHGETEWNLERRYPGSLGFAADRARHRSGPRGRAVVGSLPDAACRRIVASPLGRARRTAEIIREHLLRVWSSHRRSAPRDFGRLLGWADYTTSPCVTPGIFDGAGRHEWYFRSPDGDTYEAFAEGVAEWLRRGGGAAQLVAVTHGIVSRVLRGLYAGLPREVALGLRCRRTRSFDCPAASSKNSPCRRGSRPTAVNSFGVKQIEAGLEKPGIADRARCRLR